MAYTKQNFENGQVLTAEQLNHMEQGIAAPDWNDVTNKPFGDEFFEIVPETEVVGVEQEGVYGIELDISLFDGTEKTLVFTFDNVAYRCNVFYVETLPCFGNSGLMGLGADTGEPFFAIIAPAAGLTSMMLLDGDMHVVGVKKVITKKLDPNYYEAHAVIYAPNNEERYLYKDPGCTVRLTQTDLKELVEKDLSVHIHASGVVCMAMKPLNIVPYYSDYGIVTVCLSNQFETYYTAEYTG